MGRHRGRRTPALIGMRQPWRSGWVYWFICCGAARLYERAVFAGIVLAALAGLAGLDHESRAKTRARLVAWITGQNERLERKVKDARA